MAECIPLRAHHLLCLLGFRGLGYSKEFVANMSRISSKLASGRTAIKLVEGCDAIYAPCPHMRDDRCQRDPCAEERARQQDAAVARRLALEAGGEYLAAEVFSQIRSKLSAQALKEICRECPWLSLGYCAEAVSAS